MSGALLLLLLYTFMAWTGTTLLFMNFRTKCLNFGGDIGRTLVTIFLLTGVVKLPTNIVVYTLTGSQKFSGGAEI
jgi:hypothetical protein